LHQQQHALFTSQSRCAQARGEPAYALLEFAVTEAIRIVDEGQLVRPPGVAGNKMLRKIEPLRRLGDHRVNACLVDLLVHACLLCGSVARSTQIWLAQPCSRLNQASNASSSGLPTNWAVSSQSSALKVSGVMAEAVALGAEQGVIQRI